MFLNVGIKLPICKGNGHVFRDQIQTQIVMSAWAPLLNQLIAIIAFNSLFKSSSVSPSFASIKKKRNEKFPSALNLKRTAMF